VIVGCCGWPEARAAYFTHFQAVELQDTFYQPPSVELARKWKQQAPAGFIFTLKAWQLITHAASSPTYRRLKTPPPASRRAACGSFQPTREVRDAWQTTLAVARALDAAAIVFQCPASFRPSAENVANLEAFFREIEREGRLFAWEPRGDWDPELVRRLCQKLDLVHCVDPFTAEPLHTPTVYFRLHGRGGYLYRYTDEELAHLHSLCRRYGDRLVYVMFNNTSMRDDALRFLLATSCPPAR